jgi:hypothetical protein
MAQVLISDLGVVGQNAIMHQENTFRLIEVGMGIPVNFLSTSRPSRMSYANFGNSNFGHDLIEHPFNTTVLFRSILVGILYKFE